MVTWIKTNVEAMMDAIRYKWYQLAFRYYRRRAKINNTYAMRADMCLDKMDEILDKWEAIMREVIE